MHHLYPSPKGDPLCPLGFHPQVRWPTRCKRCFRDYKEHGNRKEESLRRDDLTSSSPSLSSWSSSSRFRDDSRSSSSSSTSSTDSGVSSRSSSSSESSTSRSTTNEAEKSPSSEATSRFAPLKPTTSWTSTPDLKSLRDDAHATTVHIRLPRRPVPADTGQKVSDSKPESYTIPKKTSDLRSSESSKSSSSSLPATKTTSATSSTKSTTAATRSRASSSSTSSSSSGTSSIMKSRSSSSGSGSTSGTKRVQIQSLKEIRSIEEPTNPDVEFIIQVKSSGKTPKKGSETVKGVSWGPPSSSSGSGSSSSSSSVTDDDDDDISSLAGTETTETTLVDRNEDELQEQIDSLKTELDQMRSRCARLEREKSDMLLRKIAAMDTAPSKTAASEVLKLQQKVNELQTQNEDFRDEQKSLNLRVKELEEELESRPVPESAQKIIDELKSKLHAAETLCEELMDENEDIKKEMRDLEEEIDEMQDNFREDQAEEYASLKKELEQTAKNCRILQFKLRKSERKSEQMEADKLEVERKCRELVGGSQEVDRAEKIKKLEQEVAISNEVAIRLQKEIEELQEKLKAKNTLQVPKFEADKPKKAPKLGQIAKTAPGETISRESMRGGSQDDPAQLLRDLQDSMEREADLREQLRFAEEEAQNLRKKLSRVEDDNESLVLQLKKMASKARSRRRSPSPARMTPEPNLEKDEGISDDLDDPAELRLQLELNEQEAAVLRRKVEDLEVQSESMKTQIKELQDKLAEKITTPKHFPVTSEPSKGGGAIYDKKMKVLEEEMSELRKKLIEKERDNERLQTEITLTQKRPKGTMQRSRSLDSNEALDLRRQLQVIEQEASVLRTKTQSLESENERLTNENKRLQVRAIRKPSISVGEQSEQESNELKEKVKSLEGKLTEANNKINELKAAGGKEEKPVLPTKTPLSDVKAKKVKEAPEVEKLKKEKEDLQKDVKTKADEYEKLKTQLTKVEVENDKLNETLTKLKDASNYKERTPKKPGDMTSKLQMKKMVEDLENEIGELMVVLKNTEDDKKKLQEKVESVKKDGDKSSNNKQGIMESDIKKKLEELEAELKTEKERADKAETMKKKLLRDKKTIEEERKKAEEEKKKAEDEKKRLETEKKKLSDEKKKSDEAKKKAEEDNKKAQEENKQLMEGKKAVEEEVKKLNSEKTELSKKQEEMNVFIERIESLKRDLDDEKAVAAALRRELEDRSSLKEETRRVELEKGKLQKEITEKNKKIIDVEKKVKDLEDKTKKNERILNTRKEKITKLEKELEEERQKLRQSEGTQKEVSVEWLKERDDLKREISNMYEKTENLQEELSAKEKKMKELEASVKEEQKKAVEASVKKGSPSQELRTLREENAANKTKLQELSQKAEKAEKAKKTAEDKLKKMESQLEKEREELESKLSDIDMDLQAERKRMEKLKHQHELEITEKEQEISNLKTKAKSSDQGTGTSSKKISEVREEYKAKIKKLEEEIAQEHQEYEDLTAKYELLEEDYVVTKAQLVMEKEQIEGEFSSMKEEFGSLETELKTLRETYNLKQDTWIKEKLDLQEKLKELEERASRNGSGDTWNVEKRRLRALVDEKTSEIDQLRRESAVINDQMDHMKKENEELRRNLEDFERVAKIHRSMNADTTATEKQLKELKTRMSQEERNHKAEIAQVKMRYDSRVALIGEELQSLQSQVAKFKRERDTFRHMLEGAQKTIGDLKAGKIKENRLSNSNIDEAEETRDKIATLDQQITCLEDELSEARLDCSKVKTELISERSSWEIKLSEMQSRINELEEERILSSGRTKIPGLKTRMELAWHKEREEQQRLLQETSTLARDLRQTLFEVERERDKERLENKRKYDQLKKTMDEEQDENKKKVSEFQCDLLELRDAHAKLRTTNEKLRREKERYEKEREELRQVVAGKKRMEADEDRKINSLLEQVDLLMKLAPDLFTEKKQKDDKQKKAEKKSEPSPTPPRRTKGPRSREVSPSLERKEFNKEPSLSPEERNLQLQATLKRLTEATDELRKFQKMSEEEREKERAKKTQGFRRAASTESENPSDDIRWKSSGLRGAPQKRNSLYRKSLSLEQTTTGTDQSIWKAEDGGSNTSLQSFEIGSETSLDSRFLPLQHRDPSLDRLSTDSTQSEMIGEKKKKKGIFGKLKQLTKSRSIDETNTGEYVLNAGLQAGSVGGSGSDISVDIPEEKTKKDMKDKFTGMFKKGSSRSSSTERTSAEREAPFLTESMQRPLTQKSGSGTLPRASPAPSDISQTTSYSRPLGEKSSTEATPKPGTSSRQYGQPGVRKRPVKAYSFDEQYREDA